MITAKSIHAFSHTLDLLYVEDDPVLRSEMAFFFEPFFSRIDMASNGKEGLERYNEHFYDLVITDINMPVMNGIEMIEHIREINLDQKIIAISAHNESDILINLIQSGVSSFILKPVIQENVLKVLYSVCRDANAQKVNLELFETLNEQRAALEKQIRMLRAQTNTTAVKHQQIELLLEEGTKGEENLLVKEYFERDDEEEDKVLFHSNDCDEMLEIMEDGIDALSRFGSDGNLCHIEKIGEHFRKMSSLLYLYSPFLDPLAQSMEELGSVIAADTRKVSELFSENQQHFFALMDAIRNDIEGYLKRFSVESMAMKNIHHIHKPTSLSIQQVIGLICPEEIDAGEIEFF